MVIITISGYPGSGKDDVGKILEKKLGYSLISIGNTRRKMAKKRGMTIQEFNLIKDPKIDTIPDRYQRMLGRTADNFIFEGRLSWKFIPESYKIFLTVNPQIGAERIYNARRTSELECSTIEEQRKINFNRCINDQERYLKNYGIKNCYDLRHFNIIIDTSKKSQEEVAEEIIKFTKLMK